ncbi:MAG: ABC transporter permease, partial [Bryobacteraceae bacterium]
MGSANSALFSVVHSVILMRLPYRNPEELVIIWQRFPNMPDPPGARLHASRRNYLAWKRDSRAFAGMAALRQLILPETGSPTRATVSVAAAGFDLFPMLGVTARAGRLFRTEEEERGRDLVAVLSDAFFAKRFGRDPATIGRTIGLGGASYTIIGVLPPEFHLPSTHAGEDQWRPEVWVPLSR